MDKIINDGKGINVLSLFDGMSVGRIALEIAKIKVNNYYSSEIKEEALKVTTDNYPQDIINRLGDITKLDTSNLPKIDLLIGGFPCTDLSSANKDRLGLKGKKSGLFYEYLRVLEEVKPTYFLVENVRMKKDQQDIISKLLGVEPIVINSSLVSPQLRHRLYWTNIPNINKLKDRNIKLNNILINGYSDRDKARALLESDSRPLSTPIKMCHRYFNTGFTTLIFKDKQHYLYIKSHFNINFKGKSAKDIDKLISDMNLDLYNGVRYMNKEEREKCQTIPKGYTNVLSENQAAGVLGDGWTAEVIAHILSHLPNKTK